MIGRTSAQLKAAPKGALYIWPAGDRMPYAVALAKHLGRTDITFCNPSILDEGGVGLRGHTRPLVVDHAVSLSQDQRRVMSWYLAR